MPLAKARAPLARPLTTRISRKYPGAAAARRKFLEFFPGGFRDDTYLAWERNYKWTAHQQWNEELNRKAFEQLLKQNEYKQIAGAAVRLESRTNLLFSFEKMALRDAVRSSKGARDFAMGLYDLVYGSRRESERFDQWVDVLVALPRKQTRVLTWPLATIFGFLAMPARNIFLKPKVTRKAAERYGFDFRYDSAVAWPTYASFLEFAQVVRNDVQDLGPRDMIDIQSYIWVAGSEEYD